MLLILAILAVLPVYSTPTTMAPGLSYAYLFVIDVTQSMNVRDQDSDAGLASRLDAAKGAVAAGLRQLPCGSRASLGLFAGNEVLVLFEPLEICAHYPAMEKVVAGIDWRMAWTGNSQVDAGIVSAMAEAAKRGLNLVFVSDGDQAPQRDELRLHNLQARRGSAKGLIVGVGGEQPRPVPKLDASNQIVGYWEPEDAIRHGFNPNLAVVLDGLEPQEHSLLGAITQAPQEHLSALRSAHLEQLARAAGLDYLRLDDRRGFARALDRPALANMSRAQRDLRIVFGLLAAGLLLAAWLLPERLGHIRHTAVAAPTQSSARRGAARQNHAVSR